MPEDDAPARRVRIRMDLRPLRHSRDFRWVFASGLVTYLGSMVTMVALPFQVAELTGSYVAVGLIGLAELVPLIVFGLWGGAMADAVDRRRVVLVTEFASLALSVILLVNALLPDPHLWVIYVVAMLFAAVDGLQRPSLEAIIPRVVAHDELAAAGALNSLRWQVGSIVGPALGGLLDRGVRRLVGLRVRRRHLPRLRAGALAAAVDPAERVRRAGQPGPDRRGDALRVVAQGPAGHLRGGHDGHGLRVPLRPVPVPRRGPRGPVGPRASCTPPARSAAWWPP